MVRDAFLVPSLRLLQGSLGCRDGRFCDVNLLGSGMEQIRSDFRIELDLLAQVGGPGPLLPQLGCSLLCAGVPPASVEQWKLDGNAGRVSSQGIEGARSRGAVIRKCA